MHLAYSTGSLLLDADTNVSAGRLAGMRLPIGVHVARNIAIWPSDQGNLFSRRGGLIDEAYYQPILLQYVDIAEFAFIEDHRQYHEDYSAIQTTVITSPFRC